MRVAEALAAITARLACAGIEEPRREARLILAAANNTDAAGLLALAEVPENFAPLLARRAAREPLAYILGRKEFWGLSFAVSPATLIPRPESETLIEAALALPAPKNILDLGTGTGCLLLACLHEFPAAYGIGVDISPAAAALARRNARVLGLLPRAAFMAGHWATAISQKFSLVLANPPYIPAAEMPALMPEVAGYEPATALAGGPDGLAAYREIMAALPSLLSPGGTAILELGAGQAEAVARLAAASGFSCATRQDLSGHARAALLARPK